MPNSANGIKDFSQWPTIPQLYVKGEFVGGCDITREMFQSGELATLLQEKGLPVKSGARLTTHGGDGCSASASSSH